MTATESPHLLRFGVFEFDPTTGDLWKEGRATRLQDQPRQVLTMLLAQPGELITREQLRAALWPQDTFVDFDTGLNVVINKIRQALGDSASAPRFIETLPRRGYRFIAPVIPGQLEHRPRDRARVPRVAVGILAALSIAGATWWIWARHAADRSASSRAIDSLAVLPLENLSGDAAEEYLVDGISDALVTDLASIRALRVISRQSTKRYKGSTATVSTIARELGVDGVIEGSVLRAGSRIRVNLKLTDARSDRHVWAQSYDQEFGDIVQLQREAAAGIAQAIQVALTPAERARLGRSGPVNTAAHDAYLRAQYLLSGMAESPSNTSRALDEFQRAIKLDPAYAPAHVGLARAHQLRGTFLGGHPPLEERRMAYAAAKTALDLDPELGEAHAILGRVQLSEFDWAGARRSFAKMLELAPGHGPGLVWYAYSLLEQGRIAEALDVASRSEAIDPLDLNTRVRVGFMHMLVSRSDEAIRRYREVLALDPNHIMALTFLVSASLQKERTEEALAVAMESLRRHGRQPLILGDLALAQARAGRRTEAQATIDELLALSKRQYVAPAHLARAYDALGDRDRAFEWFERAYEERSNFMMFYPITKMNARPEDPRYLRLVQKIRAQHAVR